MQNSNLDNMNSNLSELRPVLLWTNGVTKLAENTTIDLGDTYSYIDIEYASMQTSSRQVQRAFPTTSTGVLQGILNSSASDTYLTFASRSFVFNGSSIVFNKAYTKHANENKPNSAQTDKCVPRRIWGYK